MDNILQLSDVLYHYNGKSVLNIPVLDIQRGSITGLAGPNGSGKTTLLKLLAHIEKPSAGSVEYFEAKSESTEISIRQSICLLPQETYLLRRSVFDNISYGLKIRNRTKGLTQAVTDVLDLVGLELSFAKRHWHELSGGEAQRVALAGRLILKPDCLLLDEPTASVDMESARCIRRAVLLAQKEWGATVIIASHHRAWLNDISDRIIYLYNGRLLDCSYENVLFGPWNAVDADTVACTLSDGQKVYGKKTPHSGCSGVISAETIAVQNGPTVDEGLHTLRGIITAITLENQQNGLKLHVSCGDQRFVISICDTDLEKDGYRPGMAVTLSYRREAITWLEK